MGGFYDRMASTGKSLLTRYGKDFLVSRVVNGAYSTASGSIAQTVSSYTVKGQVFDFSAFQVAQSGGLILSTDKGLLISLKGLAVPIDPTTDSVNLNGALWKIERVIKPVDEQVIATLQLRKV